MRALIRAGAVVLAVSTVTAACTSVPAPIAEMPDPDGEVASPVQRIPPNIDPLLSGNEEQIRHVSMLFEGLMTFDPKTLAPVPAAARGQPAVSADGLTYTFTLREGLKYSDGSALRAHDFAFALSRPCTPGFRSAPVFARLIAGCEAVRRLDPQKARAGDVAAMRGLVGVRANSDTELVIVLSERAPYFTAITALPVALPVRERDVSRSGDAFGTQRAVATLVGNGPFRLVQWDEDQRLVFERNEHYRTPAKLKRWTKVVVPLDVALAAYRNGEIDFFGGLPSVRIASVAENLAEIEADPALRSQIVHAGGAAVTDYFILNVSRPPFTDQKVRQAFAKAIDREPTREFLKFSAYARSLVPPGRPGHDAGDTFQSFDPAAARELLRSSSFAGRPELSAIKLVYDTPPTRTPAEFLQQSLKRNLAVEIALELVDRTTYTAMFDDPRTVPHIRFARHIESFADPHAWFAAFRSTAGIAAGVGYRNLELDALITEAAQELDAGRRGGLYERASRVLSEDALAIWFVWQANTYLRKPHVRGVTDSPRDTEYGLMRITDIHVIRKR